MSEISEASDVPTVGKMSQSTVARRRVTTTSGWRAVLETLVRRGRSPSISNTSNISNGSITPTVPTTSATSTVSNTSAPSTASALSTTSISRVSPIRRWQRAGIALPFVALAFVEFAVRAGWIASNLVPAPSEIALSLWQMGATRVLRHIGASCARVLAGFSIGAACAVLLGGAMGLSRRLEALLDPTFQAMRAIPSLAWVPLLLLWMGIDEAPKITLVAIGAFFPVHLSVVAGIRDVDRKLVELGKVAGLSRAALVRRILLPAAMPQIFSGLRIGLAVSWMFVVAAELIAATRGLGYLLSDGRETGRTDWVFAAIALFGILGKASDSVLKFIEHRSLHWRDTEREPEGHEHDE